MKSAHLSSASSFHSCQLVSNSLLIHFSNHTCSTRYKCYIMCLIPYLVQEKPDAGFLHSLACIKLPQHKGNTQPSKECFTLRPHTFQYDYLW